MLEHERPIDGRDRYLTVYSIAIWYAVGQKFAG